MKAYQYYPVGVCRRAWACGFVSAHDALRVAAWKQARIPAAMSVNPPLQIERVTAAAMAKLRASGCQHWQPFGNQAPAFWQSYEDLVRDVVGAKSGRTGLYALDGLGYPMASAILCVLDPTMFPVIDQHAVRAIFGTEPDGSDFGTKKWYCARVYAAYARHLATVVHNQWPAHTFHRLDVEAMRAGKRIRVEDRDGSQQTRLNWPVVGMPAC